ncbi:carbohydrate porin, partial [Dorea formicigenerans]|uniref:carbohydrate porin n=1 Tax=Dorea formicigenerans TaxID=39486 RepID=UPI001EDE5C2B
NPQYRNQNGVNFRIQDPPLFMGEGQWRHGSPDGPFYPGTLRLGGWLHLGKFADQRLTRVRRTCAAS